MRAVFRSFP
ncbi:hypothetical protein OIU74_003570, partial [Salix koriyanagi]